MGFYEKIHDNLKKNDDGMFELNHALKPKPSILLVVCSVITFGACLVLISASIAAMVAVTWNPCSLIGGAILLPIPVVLSFHQFRGTFHANESAALTSAQILFAVGGFSLFCFGVTLSNLLFDPLGIPWGSFLIPPLLFGMVALVFGWLNLRWSRQLKSSYSQNSDSVDKPRFLLRDLLAGLIAIIAVTLMTIYFIQSTLPQYAENVPANRVPCRLPATASNVSYCQGGRGTIACEFTIDEAAFIKWVDTGIGSFESQAAAVSLQPITAPFSIRRYNNLSSDLNGSDYVTILEGLYYRWRKEDRGVYAAYDRSRNRAYYYAHYH